MRIAPAALFAFLTVTVAVTGGLIVTAGAAPVCPAPKPMHFEVGRSFRRDVLGFTEGLEVHDHDLYESTGALDGGSRLLRMTPAGHVTPLNDYGTKFFGEGLTILKGALYQLTWRDHEVYVYDLKGKRLRTMANPHDGWGLTNDGRRLIFGDGGDTLFFADPKTFAIQGSITVRRGGNRIENINELEYVGGKIYANIWQTRAIVRIDAGTGCIEAEAKMDTLWDHMPPAERDYTGIDPDFVLNGIAYDPGLKLFYLTGKEWPTVFAGRFVDGNP